MIAVSAGADVYHPSLAYLLSISGACVAVWAGQLHREDASASTTPSARSPCTACAGFYGVFLVGIFAGGYPTGLANVESSMGGQLMGIMAFIPLAFLPGYFFSWILKKMNLLRVPPEVELEGLDMAEFGMDFYPEFERVPEIIVEPDGREVDSAPVLLDAYWQTNGKAPAGRRRRRRGKELGDVRHVPVRRVERGHRRLLDAGAREARPAPTS